MPICCSGDGDIDLIHTPFCDFIRRLCCCFGCVYVLIGLLYVVALGLPIYLIGEGFASNSGLLKSTGHNALAGCVMTLYLAVQVFSKPEPKAVRKQRRRLLFIGLSVVLSCVVIIALIVSSKMSQTHPAASEISREVGVGVAVGVGYTIITPLVKELCQEACLRAAAAADPDTLKEPLLLNNQAV